MNKTDCDDIINKPNFEEDKDYTITEISKFLKEYKGLMSASLENLFFRNEMTYWNWFLTNDDLSYYEKVADELASNIDSILDESYEDLSVKLQKCLYQYIDKIKHTNNSTIACLKTK